MTNFPVWPPVPTTAMFMCPASRQQDDQTSVRNATSRTVSDMPSVALAVADGTPLFELAAACEVFGVDRGLTGTWYDFMVCGPDGAEVGGWLRAGIAHDLNKLASADTV